MRGSSGCLALLSQSYPSSYLYCKAPLAKDFTLHHQRHISAAAASSSSSSSWSCSGCRRRRRRKSHFLSLTPFTTYYSFTLKNKSDTNTPKFVPSTSAFMLDNCNSTQQPTPPIDIEKDKGKDKDKDLVGSIMPKIDKSGRFCSPRAARELSLLIVYAACLEGSDPVRLFEKRMNVRREPGYQFDKESLLEYNHMSFGGPPVVTETAEEANELLHSDEKESAAEAEVLSAPPKLVYSKLILRFTRRLLVAVVDYWDSHVLILDKVAPSDWKNEPVGRILELCILHLAMSEIAVLGTRHQIVINEAVDLAKRFCDGSAPRVINGCLRTFVKGLLGTSYGVSEASDTNQRLEV